MLLDILNVSTLAVLGYIDYRMYKIPNVILVGWLGALVTIGLTSLNVANGTAHILNPSTLIVSLLVAGSFIPLHHIVKCSAGDFKLYGVLTVAKGIDDSLTIIFLSMLISVLPITGGVKKIPMAFTTFFGYIAFILLRFRG